MIDPRTPIYVQLAMSIADAKELEEILKPLVDVYDSRMLGAILDLSQQIQQLPSIIEAHDAIQDNDEAEDDEIVGENEVNIKMQCDYWDNTDGMERYGNGILQNWRMN
jgi:hypothetical protein